MTTIVRIAGDVFVKSGKSKKSRIVLKTHSGWKKDMPMAERRALTLQAHHGNLLAAARGKQALANLTKDSKTKKESERDAKFFFQEYEQSKKGK